MPAKEANVEHREQRNWRIETTNFSYGSYDETVSERYCVPCGEWIEVRGVLGAIEWDAHHGDLHNRVTAGNPFAFDARCRGYAATPPAQAAYLEVTVEHDVIHPVDVSDDEWGSVMTEEHPTPASDAILEHVDEYHAADVFPDADGLAESHDLFHKEA